MIMINSIGTVGGPRRTGGGAGPPPPVPPRPSKSVVAEALAKTRRNNGRSPSRRAPPPPLSVATGNEIAKSKSSYSVNLSLKKPPTFERSISEELKPSPRPVIYQSTNIKLNNNNTKVQIKPQREIDVKNINRVDSFSKISRSDSLKKVSRKSSIKRETCVDNSDEYITKIENCVGDIILKDNHQAAPRSDGRTEEVKSINGDNKSSLCSEYSDPKCWDTGLNDRNHVNTLIDEMFASVLEIQPIEEEESNNNVESVNENVGYLSDDKTKIVIGSGKVEDKVTLSVEAVSTEGVVPKTVIVIKNEEEEFKKESSGSDCNSVERLKQVKFNDQTNHEQLISELQCMRKDQEKILKRQRKPSKDIFSTNQQESADYDSDASQGNSLKVRRPDRLEITTDRSLSKRNSLRITWDDRTTKGPKANSDRLATTMSSLHGLPPLPKSLSGFSLPDNQNGQQQPPTPLRSSSIQRQGSAGQTIGQQTVPHGSKADQIGSRKTTGGLDAKLAMLRQEMYSLRQLDLSLLGQLWSLNESIQDFRQLLMLHGEQRETLSPPSPSPSSPAPSSLADDDEDEGDFYVSATSLDYRPVPPPPPSSAATPRRTSCSSDASSPV